MPEPQLIRRERDAVQALLEAIAQRDRRETELLAWYQTQKVQLDKQTREERQQIETRHAEVTARAEDEARVARGTIPRRMRERVAQLDAARENARIELMAAWRRNDSEARDEADSARWEATTLFEASKGEIQGDLDRDTKKLDEIDEALASIREDAALFLTQCRMARAAERSVRRQAEPPEVVALPGDPLGELESATAGVEERLARLEGLSLPRLFRNGNFVTVYIVPGLLLIVPAAFLTDPLRGILIGVVLSLVIGTVVTILLYRIARRQIIHSYPDFAWEQARTEDLAVRCRQWVGKRAGSRLEAASQQHTLEVRKSERRLSGLLSDLEAKRDEDLARVESEFRAKIERVRQEHEAELAAVLDRTSTTIETARAEFHAAIERLEADDQRRRDEFRERTARLWSELCESWKSEVDAWTTETERLNQECGGYFLDWSKGDGTPSDRVPPRDGAPAMRFGRFAVDLNALPKGLPRDPKLRELVPRPVELPALMPMPGGDGPFVVRAYGDGREPALELIRALMLRMLTSVPPGKLRFTIVDPIGLGQNFAGFMHLADFDEALVGSRIWTEEQHIETKLADLTEHMEKVIQKYLRNEFEAIQQYNENAGEVAEPYRVLVVANFPANFNENSGRRLVSICQNGPRCGVYPLLMIDERETLPPGVTPADLERAATILVWREGRLVWKDPEFGGYPLTLDQPPTDAVFTELLQRVGRQAKEASRVEVPFHIVVPREEAFWTGDSRKGLEVPLGRVGANKLQYLRLGQGTSQHVLIAGRTGSGKSTLLHALIVSAALRYPPDQVELYLIDFKKGVEFKTYATRRLPHARVVAIESEREFGLSVLQRLDQEMKDRGETFRLLGVQDLAGYRDARRDGQPTLPRLLLVVDEFQEFFVEDDRVAQDAALMLDRLVRQGRAFGIHVLLGSQSLGGAFTLARSTMGQMAVRIALQCSESDAHLILNEENTAARLLSRPGEAIYNDSNGAIEGNDFFQVVWLADSRRDDYLDRVGVLDRERNPGTHRPQIVFEGQVAADLADNYRLDMILEGPPPEDAPRAPLAWLGDAVAIKDPTAATFRRQSGANLLVVGQGADSAMGLTLAALASLAAQYPPTETGIETDDPLPRFLFLDGTPDDAAFVGLAGNFLRDLDSAEVLDWRQAGDAVGRLAAELKARQEAARYDAPAVYLVVFNLSRFRDLKKSDDDFGFGRRDAGDSPAQQFVEVLREGPAFGIHTIVWCDSWNNLQRTLDRQALREFELRVLFQMSPSDSSNLIDSPIAGKLGPHRAFYSSEEEGILEKFRPYGIPSRSCWERFLDRMRRRRDVRAAADP